MARHTGNHMPHEPAFWCVSVVLLAVGLTEIFTYWYSIRVLSLKAFRYLTHRTYIGNRMVVVPIDQLVIFSPFVTPLSHITLPVP